MNFGQINVATISDFNVQSDCYGNIRPYNSTAVNVVSSIVLPNGRSYQFQYDDTYGGLTSIETPTGAIISYTWATHTDGMKTHRYVASRTLTADGNIFRWTFTGPGVVMDPYGNQTYYSIGDDGAIYQAFFYQGTSTGTLLRRVQLDYVSDSDPWNDNGSADCSVPTQEVALRPTRITTTLDDNQVSKIEFDYENFSYSYHQLHLGYVANPGSFTTIRGNIAERREYAFGAGAAGSLMRRTTSTFLHGSDASYKNYNIVNKVLDSTIYDGSNNKAAETQYEYDSTSIINVTGVPQQGQSLF